MNLSEFISQPCDAVVYNIFARLNSKGKLSYTLQVLQSISRNTNVASRRNFLLSATQGGLNARKLTALVSISPSRIDALLEPCGVEGLTENQVKDINNGNTVFLFSAQAANKIILVNDLGFFGADVSIELTESPFKNPYQPNQSPVVNPSTGDVKLYATEGVMPTEVYAHTELCPTELVNHQFIEDYFRNADARDYPETVAEQMAKEKASTIIVANAEIDATEF